MAKSTWKFFLDDVQIDVEYKNVKTMRLTVYPPDGRVKLSAPFETVPADARKFGASKYEWIVNQRSRVLNHSKTAQIKNHAVVHVWGIPHELIIVEHKGNSKIVIEDKYIKMYARPEFTKARKLEILDKWYSRIIKQTAPKIINKYEQVLGLKVKKLYVRKMKTYWGSCNCEKQTLRLNSELAKRDPVCLEYVIIHEMLHLIEKSHNRIYYKMLNEHFPSWKIIRKKMNKGEL
jgi:predicted metal-dependent hydrolase